jgi:hypothetical protein
MGLRSILFNTELKGAKADRFVKSQNMHNFVIPVKTGI